MKLPAFVAFLGTLVTLGAIYLYVPYWPELGERAFALPVLDEGDPPLMILAGLGGAWSLFGTFQAFRLGKSKFMKLMLFLLMVPTLALSGGLSYHAMVYAKELPDAPNREAGEKLPDFELKDQKGETINNASLKGKRVVLVFHRGVW